MTFQIALVMAILALTVVILGVTLLVLPLFWPLFP
jgi:hypothetical protein